jgi:short-subunit dehydrogenase
MTEIIIKGTAESNRRAPSSTPFSREIDMKIEGSVALVTGANSGIGQAFVRELLKRGASKIYLGVRNPASLSGLFSESSKLVLVTLDVTKPKQIEDAAKAASDITLLINNAGAVAFSGALAAKDLAAARQEMEVNYFGVLALTRAFNNTPALRSGGCIVNVLSFLALVTLPVAGTYSASKSAALALTRTLRAELKPRGVQVLGAIPVQTDTPAYAPLPEPKLQPEEVASGTLDAVEAGQDEVFPGALSRAAAEVFKQDSAALQARMSTVVHAID